MTDHSILIAIAETLPRYQLGNDHSGSTITSKGAIIRGEPMWQRANGWPVTCPDYLNDLNACHDLYRHLVSISEGGSARRQPDVLFKLHLMALVNPGKELWDNGRFLGDHFDALNVIDATVAQWCEAYLRALDKWEETP